MVTAALTARTLVNTLLCAAFSKEDFTVRTLISIRNLRSADMPGSSAERITTIASKMLAKRGGRTTPVRDQNLREAGLTSLDMVNLVLAIELEFDIEIAENMMTPENFDTIAAIEALLSDIPKAA